MDAKITAFLVGFISKIGKKDVDLDLERTKRGGGK